MTGAGRVDLLRKRLAYRVVPKVASTPGGELAGLAVPVIVIGPWANPKVYPDMQGILENPQAAFDALNKLGVPTGNIDVKAVEEQVKERAKKEITRTIENQARELIGDEAAKALGQQGADQAEQLGGSLLNNLLGRPRAPEPAPQ